MSDMGRQSSCVLQSLSPPAHDGVPMVGDNIWRHLAASVEYIGSITNVGDTMEEPDGFKTTTL